MSDDGVSKSDHCRKYAANQLWMEAILRLKSLNKQHSESSQYINTYKNIAMTSSGQVVLHKNM